MKQAKHNPALVTGRLVLAGCLLLATGLAAAQAYKWVDADGKVHFSDTPPPDRKADKIKIRPQAAENPQAAAQRRDWQTQLQESGVRRLQDQQKQEAAENKSKVDEQNCRAARAELDLFQGGRVFRYDKDGQKQYLEDKDRPAARQAAQDKVDKYCR